MEKLSGIRGLRQRWEDYRPTKTQAFWTAVGGIAATLIIGFGVGGWVTGGTAQEMVSEAATNARNQLATAVCVDEFMRAANASTRLEKFKKAIYYERDDLVAAGGWATMPDKKEPNTEVAVLCASRLYELKAPASVKVTPAAVQSISTSK
jgi:hypothetical protein